MQIVQESLEILNRQLAADVGLLGKKCAPGAFAAGATIDIKRPKRYSMDMLGNNLNSSQIGRPAQNPEVCKMRSDMTPEAACQSGAAMGGCSTPDRSPSVRVFLDVAANSSFSEALRHVVDGGHAACAGWNGPGQYVFAQYPDKGSKMTAPYLVLRNSQGGYLPWVPSQGDVFARDWAMIPGRTHDVS